MQLWAGVYHVYVNAFDSEENVELRSSTFVDPFTVDIYLGDGVSNAQKYDTLSWSKGGGMWFYVGFFDVFIETKTKCEGLPNSKTQQAGDSPVDLCVTWNRFGKLVDYPLNGRFS